MLFTLRESVPLTETVYRFVLEGDTSACARPGQFVQVSVPGFFLRRPISVCDWGKGSLTLVFKVVGEGTRAMARLVPGTVLDLLPGLGNGFDPALCGDHPLLVGGGVGLPPLYGLCKRLLASGKAPRVMMGFNTASEVFLWKELKALDVPVFLATMDGSAGKRGLVTDLLSDAAYDSLCGCGPEPMLRALFGAVKCPGQYSLEARMACGFGACMGCSIQTRSGAKRVCREGPVFEGKELLW